MKERNFENAIHKFSMWLAVFVSIEWYLIHQPMSITQMLSTKSSHQWYSFFSIGRRRIDVKKLAFEITESNRKLSTIFRFHCYRFICLLWARNATQLLLLSTNWMMAKNWKKKRNRIRLNFCHLSIMYFDFPFQFQFQFWIHFSRKNMSSK